MTYENILVERREAGFDRHFCKPVDAQALLTEISRLIPPITAPANGPTDIR